MIRNNKSRRRRAGNILTKYLKFKAIGKAVKGAGTTAKWTAYGKAAKAAQRPPKKAWLAMAGGAGAAALAARKLRRTSSDPSQPTPA